MTDTQNNINRQADFTPTKRFFVDMLTRDIDLADAILDLLDNCLDGVARSQKKNPEDIDYAGYKAEINFNTKEFVIEDNCGGIPRDSANYAFRMGKPLDAPTEDLATVGVYGIGMKRSIFKIGNHCEIETQHSSEDNFKIIIDESWLQSDSNWHIPIQEEMPFKTDNGTKIHVTKLNELIVSQFKKKKFKVDLVNKIVFSYSYIISKGFQVFVNGEQIKPNPINLRYETSIDSHKKSIKPYVYEATIDDVEIKLIVGFHSPLVDETVEEEEKIAPKYKTEDAGWTIVCNDRIVVYRDKTELTGWGVHFARYHTQFIAISGVLYFKSKYPEKLPITTTKRGIDASSKLFQKAQKHIIDGTKLFINYTNQWKGEELLKKSNERLKNSKEASPLQIIEEIKTTGERFTRVRNNSNELYFKPDLPIPEEKHFFGKKVSFTRPLEDIELVGEYLSLSPETSPNIVGEKCFDYVYEEAKK